MPSKTIGVPIGTTYTTSMPTEFGPNGCVLGLAFISPNAVTATVVGATSGMTYYSGSLNVGSAVDVSNTTDTAVTVTLSPVAPGTNVAGQLSLTTRGNQGAPVPWPAPVAMLQPSITVVGPITPDTSASVGVQTTYARGDHNHGMNLSVAVDTATDVAITAASTFQTIASFNAPGTQNLLGAVAVVVPAGGATLAVQCVFTSAAGATTMTVLSAQATAAGVWASVPFLIPAHAGLVEIQVSSSIITTTLASATIVGV